MMHEQQGWAVLLGQTRLQPVEPHVAQFTVVPGLDQRVERDQPHRHSLDRVLQEALARQVAMVGERPAQRVAEIVIARDQIDRHGERRQHAPEIGVLRRQAVFDQIAGRQHDIGPGVERVQMRHRAFEETRGVNPAMEQLALALQVHVGNLGDQHGRSSPARSGSTDSPGATSLIASKNRAK